MTEITVHHFLNDLHIHHQRNRRKLFRLCRRLILSCLILTLNMSGYKTRNPHPNKTLPIPNWQLIPTLSILWERDVPCFYRWCVSTLYSESIWRELEKENIQRIFHPSWEQEILLLFGSVGKPSSESILPSFYTGEASTAWQRRKETHHGNFTPLPNL